MKGPTLISASGRPLHRAGSELSLRRMHARFFFFAFGVRHRVSRTAVAGLRDTALVLSPAGFGKLTAQEIEK